MLFEKDEATKATVAKILPEIATARHPNLLVNPLTIGPATKQYPSYMYMK